MKKGCLVVGGIVLLLALIIGGWISGKYNNLVTLEENVNESWSNVETQYQRRYDLIGNLVATVENAADFERGTLTDVIEARANAQKMQLNVDELSEENIQRFQEVQNDLNQSFMGRMNFLQENYPTLTATEQFRDLSSQIEGTENRINVARTRYNEVATIYNKEIRKVPMNIVAGFLGFDRKAPFSSVSGAETAPSVRDEFNRD